jgi:hypothetical protein
MVEGSGLNVGDWEGLILHGLTHGGAVPRSDPAMKLVS